MNIVYASNDAYVPFLGISLFSLLENNKQLNKISIFILSDKISEGNKEILNRMAFQYRRKIEYIDLKEMRDFIPFHFDTFGFHPIVLSRLFLDVLLNEDIHQVLYLDCDTIVDGSLAFLEKKSLGEDYVAMVPELYMPSANKKLIGLTESEPYYNAGVILFNLDMIRKDRMRERFLQYYQERNGELLYNDQDIINYCCKGRIYRLGQEYNLSPNLVYFPRYFIKKLQPAYYRSSAEEYKSVLKNPIIIHFMGDERPWIRGNHNAYRKKFERYMKLSPWKEFPLIEGQRLYMICYHILNVLTRICPWFRMAFTNLIGINKYAWFGKK